MVRRIAPLYPHRDRRTVSLPRFVVESKPQGNGHADRFLTSSEVFSNSRHLFYLHRQCFASLKLALLFPFPKLNVRSLQLQERRGQRDCRTKALYAKKESSSKIRQTKLFFHEPLGRGSIRRTLQPREPSGSSGLPQSPRPAQS